MGTITYERPREKLYQKGVSALTNAELLQVIIGSGNAGMPVTKIARKVDRVLKKSGSSVTLGDLMAISGLGLVKAGQIIAGLEMANRVAHEDSNREYKDIDVLTDLYADIRTSKKRMLLYAFFDGNNRLIDDHSEPIDININTTQVVRKLFGEALAQSTASVLIALGGNNQSLEPTMFELSLARDVYSTANLISIKVKLFVLIGSSSEYVVKEASRG